MELSEGGNSNDWFFLAMAYWQLGKPDEAHEWYDKAVEWMETKAKDNVDLCRFRNEAEELLQKVGPRACPANSRAGFGGGEGIYMLGNELVEERYTLDFFLSDNRPGHTKLLIFLSGSTPVLVEIVLKGTVITGPKPYGLGFSVDVPPIKVLPEASNASAKTAFLTLGARNVAYFRRVHGKRKLFHVKGIVLPKSCPRSGWPVASQFTFEDGSTVMAKRTIRCPRK